MAKNAGSTDKYLEALDFIINVLKEHEQVLDKSIHELATVTEQLGTIYTLNAKVDKMEEEIDVMHQEVSNLNVDQPNLPKDALQAAVQKSQAHENPVGPLSIASGGSSLIWHVKNWEDFMVLAMHAKLSSFSYDENKKIFQVDAHKENQIIRYTGPVPSFSILLKTWLSRELDVATQNILESF